MPEALTVFLWVASACAVILTVLGAAVAAVLIIAALELRAVARAIGQEVRWIREQRRFITYRTRFAGKWLRIMGQKIVRQL